MNIIVRSPESDEEFNKLLALRYTVLRQPWNQPRGSERDSLDVVAYHAIALNEAGEVVGTARLHSNSGRQSQIRFLAVAEAYRHRGIAKKLVSFLEDKAREGGAKYLRAHVRESAVGFFEKNGFQHIGEGKILFEAIKHVWMRKDL